MLRRCFADGGAGFFDRRQEQLLSNGKKNSLQTPLIFKDLDFDKLDNSLLGLQMMWATAKNTYSAYIPTVLLDKKTPFQVPYFAIAPQGYDEFKTPVGLLSCK